MGINTSRVKKKKAIFAIGGILLLFLGFALGRIGSRIPSPAESPTPLLSAQDVFKVTRVIDGDTIEIETGERVRYLGIDTPETVDPRKPVQCFGVEAAKKNKELVEGKAVRLEKDITDKDKYGRLLRYVWVEDLFVNLELVKQGFASSYTYPPDVKHQEEILAAEQEAREENRGLRGACPVGSWYTFQVS